MLQQPLPQKRNKEKKESANKFTLVFNALFGLPGGDSSVVSINDRIPSGVPVTDFLLGLFNCCPPQKPDCGSLLNTDLTFTFLLYLNHSITFSVCVSARVMPMKAFYCSM